MSINKIITDLHRIGYTVTPTRYPRVFIGGIGHGKDRIYRHLMVDDPDVTLAADGVNERVSWYSTKAEALSTLTDEYVLNYFGKEDAAAMGVVVLPAVLTVSEIIDRQASLARGLADSAAGRVTDGGDFTQYANDIETETAQWSQPATEQTITMPGLAILATLNADGTVTVEIDANGGTVQRIAINDKQVF